MPVNLDVALLVAGSWVLLSLDWTDSWWGSRQGATYPWEHSNRDISKDEQGITSGQEATLRAPRRTYTTKFWGKNYGQLQQSGKDAIYTTPICWVFWVLPCRLNLNKAILAESQNSLYHLLICLGIVLYELISVNLSFLFVMIRLIISIVIIFLIYNIIVLFANHIPSLYTIICSKYLQNHYMWQDLPGIYFLPILRNIALVTQFWFEDLGALRLIDGLVLLGSPG